MGESVANISLTEKSGLIIVRPPKRDVLSIGIYRALKEEVLDKHETTDSIPGRKHIQEAQG